MNIRHCLAVAGAAAMAAASAWGATYLPISDAELADRSPVIARGLVLEVASRLDRIGAQDLPVTITSVQVLEAFRGSYPGQVLRVRVPGGRVGSLAWWVPGAPVFEANQEVVLLLRPAEGRPGEFHLSEFGLSRFDIVQDESGRRFAVRPAFDPEEDLYASKRSVAIRDRVPGLKPTPQRDAASFLAGLRAAASGLAMPEIAFAEPRGALAGPAMSVKPEWVNVGGVEPGNPCRGAIPCLFRWYWDTGDSPTATVSVSGTQSLLSDGSTGVAHAQNAVDQWHAGVPAADIHVSGVSPGGDVTINLDAGVSYDGMVWNTPLACGTGGTIGLGGPTSGIGPRTFKGGTTYYAPAGGIVSMRQRTGIAFCYDAGTFRTAVLHELGHVLGLGHPDQSASTHSTTTSADWNTAVMHAIVPPNKPSTPQTDDIQGMQYYYGTGAAGCVANATTLCIDDQPGDKRFKVQVAWATAQGGGQAGSGQAIPLSNLGVTNGGLFWFFSATNPEMLIKVLPTCGISSRHWIFASAGTNVGLTTTITDTVTAAQKVYTNTDGQVAAPIQDTTVALPCP